MTEPSSLDARALVSEIRETLAGVTEGDWEVGDLVPHEPIPIESDGAPIATVLNAEDFPCLDDDKYDRVDAEAQATARLFAASKRLLTAALGLIEQQQEEIARLRSAPQEQVIEIDEDGKVRGEAPKQFRDPGCSCGPYDAGATRGRDSFCPVHGRARTSRAVRS
jgi:hypothetical protein